MADVTVYKGNYGENINWTLYQSDGKTPFNLGGYTVAFKVWSPASPASPIVSAAASVSVAASGTVSYTIQAGDFSQVGKYLAAFTASAGSADIDFQAFMLEVVDPLAFPQPPLTYADYLSYPLVKVPTGFTENQVTTQINNAWRTIVSKCFQPLNQTTNTDVYPFPSKNANQIPSGEIRIIPKYSPVISLTSVSWSTNIGQNGWTALAQYDPIGDSIICHDAPFKRGDYGLLQVIYDSGYATIPEDLIEACALMTAHLLSGGMFPTQGGTGEGSVLALWLPKDVQDTVNRYKRVF